MFRFCLGAAATIGFVVSAPQGVLAAAPDASKLRAAAEEFDAGARAFRSREYELAASKFEAADSAVPSPNALRMAIRSRAEAGQGSRAATLAGAALARYPGDPATIKLAKDTLEKVEPLLFKISVSCASPCVLAAGTRAIHGEASTRWVIYLDPGKTTVSASFFGDAGGAQQAVEATAGRSTDLRFEPAERNGSVAPTPAAPSRPFEPAAARPAASDAPAPDGSPSAADETKQPSGLSPLFFFGGIAVTAALGGLTIWSGIDTRTDPGPDVVRVRCAGQGPSCPEYQDGLAKQTRTNVLLGATLGAAALTGVVGVLFTRWRGSGNVSGTTNSFVTAPWIHLQGGGVAAIGRY